MRPSVVSPSHAPSRTKPCAPGLWLPAPTTLPDFMLATAAANAEVSGSVTITGISDYDFRGVSQSSNDPAARTRKRGRSLRRTVAPIGTALAPSIRSNHRSVRRPLVA